jgi:hypothetical protein
MHQQHGRKTSTLKKRSKSKNIKAVNLVSTDKKQAPTQFRKNISDKIKLPKKKINIINSSNYEDEQFRGSLPGLSGKKVLQRFAPLLSENQKI